MKYEIMYESTFPIVKFQFNKGERIKAESDAMIGMSNTVDITGGTEGGIIRGLTRILAGESFFFQYLTALEVMERYYLDMLYLEVLRT